MLKPEREIYALVSLVDYARIEKITRQAAIFRIQRKAIDAVRIGNTWLVSIKIKK